MGRVVRCRHTPTRVCLRAGKTHNVSHISHTVEEELASFCLIGFIQISLAKALFFIKQSCQAIKIVLIMENIDLLSILLKPKTVGTRC